MTNLMFDQFEELEFRIFNICSEIFNKDDLENFMQKFSSSLHFKDKGFYLAYMIYCSLQCTLIMVLSWCSLGKSVNLMRYV